MSCRIQSQNPESEMDNYASFINEALDKTKCRECVPCWEEIQTLMNRQKMLCTVHYPGPGSCQLYISSHTTANEVGEHFLSSHLCSRSNFLKKKKNTNHICCLSFVFTSKRTFWALICHFHQPAGGAEGAGEARPAGQQQHICTVQTELGLGAAGGRQRSDRRRPDQVCKVNVSLQPVNQNRPPSPQRSQT